MTDSQGNAVNAIACPLLSSSSLGQGVTSESLSLRYINTTAVQSVQGVTGNLIVQVSSNAGQSWYPIGNTGPTFKMYRLPSVNGSNTPSIPRQGSNVGKVVLTGTFDTTGIQETPLVRLVDENGWNSNGATLTVLNDGRVEFDMPAYGGAMTLPTNVWIEIALNGKQYERVTQRLTVFAQPTVLSVNPESANPTQRLDVTVTGSGFVNTGAIHVLFGVRSLPATFVSSQQVTVLLPSDMPQGQLPVEVSLDNGITFSRTSPSVLFLVSVLCQDNAFLVSRDANDSTSCVCLPEFYAPSSQGGSPCLPCPRNADCSGKLTSPKPKPGFFNVGQGSSYSFIRCPNVRACPGGASQTCTNGYQGRLCAQCQPGFYKVATTCLQCQDGSTSLPILLIIVFLILMFAIKRLAQMSVEGQSGVLSILITHLQLVAMFASFEFQWGDNTQSLLNGLGFANLDISVSAPECQQGVEWTLETQFWVSMLLPVMIIAGIGIRLLLQAVHHSVVSTNGAKFKTQHPEFCRTPSRDDHFGHQVRYYISTWFTQSSSVNSRTRRLVVNEILLSLSLLYITLCTQVLQLFDCTLLADGTTYVLDVQPEELCFVSGGLHERLFPWGIAFLGIYVIGIPVLFFILLRLGGPTRAHRLQQNFAQK
eukprot:TRINITY_DN3034_c0_g1_i2.p1 TRINITY_DN3034_c0_g1~~TRINITY_DN3034_c0_g1_i2.p1  ORF type:complete len:705 (-),score=185.04 TRINITY_DN3034_c0_g1_i2:1042-2985(-)